MTNVRMPKFRFNWRLMFVQTIANAIALGLTVLLLPGIRMPGEGIIFELLASGVIFGLLNAFVRPILQFLMFRFLFITFGLVLVVINIIILTMMRALTPERFQVDGWLSLVLAGVLVGIIGFFLEAVMGLQPPIVDEGPRARTREQLFSLGSAPVYITSPIDPVPENVPPAALAPPAAAEPALTAADTTAAIPPAESEPAHAHTDAMAAVQPAPELDLLLESDEAVACIPEVIDPELIVAADDAPLTE
jgi:putative membrane protein